MAYSAGRRAHPDELEAEYMLRESLLAMEDMVSSVSRGILFSARV
jgi:hypothetical protein